MAFIEKKDPVVLNIKITSRGRELLSQGNLNFKYFAIGDSEIDYKFNSAVNTSDVNANLPYKSLILRAADKNPNLLSFITRNNDQTYLNSISSVPSTTTIIQNTARPIGFFTVNSGTTTFITDADHVKQPDAMVKIGGVLGGTILELYKSPTYGANVNLPAAGDLLLVKWTNPSGGTNTTGYTVNKTYSTPYLIYRITEVTGGTNTLISTVRVDRELPNFGGLSRAVAGALVYYNYINYTGDTIYNYYATDYLNESVVAFLENAQCPTIRFPFWNMSVIFTEEIAGAKLTDRKYTQFNSREYGGFVSYIQNQSSVIKKMGVIHYTNSSPSNTCAEELYLNTPTLNIPTIMWHKSTTKELGVILKAYGSKKTLIGTTKSLNTTYYDLADLNGNVVGKIFNDLKLFVIEDQELLFAMSFKSNRSWTLPNYTVATNTSAVFGCPDCTVTFNVIAHSPLVQGANTGTLIINQIENVIGIAPDVELVLSVSGETHGRVYFEPITTGAVVTGLYADTYHVIVYDLRASTTSCIGQTIVLSNPNSLLAISGLTSTESGLNPDFLINMNSPIDITIPKGTTFATGIGNYYGTPKVGWKLYNAVSGPSNYKTFTGPLGVNFNDLTLGQAYTIVVKDEIAVPLTAYTVTRNYVAVGTPFKPTFATSRGVDVNGNYVLISDYITTIIPGNNPIIGTIEFMVEDLGSFPSEWLKLPIGSTVGDTMKVYCGGGSIKIKIRENYQDITAAQVTKSIDVSNNTIIIID